MPLVVGLLCAFVAYGRWRLAPHRRIVSAVSASAGREANLELCKQTIKNEFRNTTPAC